MSRPDYLKYKVSGKIVKLLGADSVSTDTAALFELVKNSYDADASIVWITFKNVQIVDLAQKSLDERHEKITTELKNSNPNLTLHEIEEIVREDPRYKKQLEHVGNLKKNAKIILEDNGSGMTVDKLENKWMVVGVDKEENEINTKKGRRTVGEKGVGRFAAEKIAHKLLLTSHPQNSKSTIIADFDWDLFNSKKKFTDMKIPISYEIKLETKHGLRLELINLKEIWSTRKIKQFIKELSVLVLPQEIDAKYPFSVKVKIEGIKEFVDIESNLYKKAPYHFKVELTEDSKIKFLDVRYKKEKIIPNKFGLELFGFEEEMPFRKNGKPAIASCGPVKFTFYGYPFDPSGRKLGWSEYYGRVDLGEFKDTIEENSGVKIYRDGFRVRPYGDKEHDWLSLGEEARRIAGRLPSQNIIGWLELSANKNPGIIDTTTREKIIENEAFEDLRNFANQTISAFSRYSEARRQQILKKEAQAQVPKMIKNLGEKIIDNPSIDKKTKTSFVTYLNQIQAELTAQDERSIIEKEALMDEKNAFRNLASLGITAGVVSHEINDFLRDIRSHTMLIKDQLNKSTPNIEKMKVNVSVIDPSAQNLLNYMALVKGFAANFASRDKGYRRKTTLSLHDEVDSILVGLKGIFKEWDIIAENKTSRSFPKIRMFRADLQSILLNLISNSIKSLRHFTDERKNLPNSKKNRIRIGTSTTSNEIIITFSDNGLGIPKSDRSHIFELFWSRTTIKDTSVSGSGLGLPIINQIVNDYGGTIKIKEKAELNSGATFTIAIPKKEIIK